MKNLTICILLFVIMAGMYSCKINKDQSKVEKDHDEEQSAENTSVSIPLPLGEPVKIDLNTKLYSEMEKEAIRARQDDSLFAFIKRTPCYGRCPIYSASFYKSGYVIYRGQRFVEKEGIYASRITQEQLLSITKMARMVNYLNFEKEYDTAVTDFPTTYTFINMNGTKKEVKNRVGGPDELKNFETYLDKILDSTNWTKIGDIGQ